MALADDIRTMLKPMTDPGGDWEIAPQVVDGQEYPVFVNHPQDMVTFFRKYSDVYADQPFMVYADEQYSFGQAWQLAGQLGHQLQQKYGISKGDRVAISMRNYPEWVLSYMAVLGIGGVAVPMNSWWVRREMEYGLKDSGASLLIADQQRYECIVEDLPSLNIRCIGVRFEQRPDGMDDVMELIRAAEGQAMPEVAVDPEDDASIMYTSGTTGFPKGALASHRSIVSALQCLQFTFEAAQLLLPQQDEDGESLQQSMLLTVPLFHVTGCVAISLASFCIGRKMVMMYKWDAGEALRLVEQEKITSFTGVPTMVWEMLQHPEFDRYDTSSLSVVGGGGAPAPVEQVKRVAEKFSGAQPGIGYGLTETNAVASINSGALYLAKPASCGMPTILGAVRIEDESGKALGPNEEGEICIRGPFVVKGYWNKPEATAEAFQDGWFHSGDVGYLDEDGFLYISSRAKDMILRAGENVYCAEVESAIYEFPGIYECSVFGVPDERMGERVAVAIMPVPGQQVDQEELLAFLRERIAHFKVPEHCFFRNEQLPRNAAGKILKTDLRAAAIGELGLKEV